MHHFKIIFTVVSEIQIPQKCSKYKFPRLILKYTEVIQYIDLKIMRKRFLTYCILLYKVGHGFNITLF